MEKAWFRDNPALLRRVVAAIGALPSSISEPDFYLQEFQSITRGEVVAVTILRGYAYAADEEMVEKAFLIDPHTGSPKGELDFWLKTESGKVRPGREDPPAYTVVRDATRAFLFTVSFRYRKVTYALCKDKTYILNIECVQ